jgi:hypothetical protein
MGEARGNCRNPWVVCQVEYSPNWRAWRGAASFATVEDMKDHEKPPLDASQFLNRLAHLESLLEARVIAWDAESSATAQKRLDQLTDGVKRIANAIGKNL